MHISISSKKNLNHSSQKIGRNQRWRVEQLFVLILCIASSIRIFLFAAGFPVFTNVDEHAHFDLICKYSKGKIPTGLGKYDHDANRMILLYGSLEYLYNPSDFPTGEIPPPIWKLPPKAQEFVLEKRLEKVKDDLNHESTQPPVYYYVAALWYKLGQVLQIGNGFILYWVRFLNIIIYSMLIWLSYMFARKYYYEDAFLRLSLPLVLAFFPQDVFFSINNDVLTPLVFTAALLCLFDCLISESNGLAFYLLTGLLIATAFLVKITAFVIFIMLGFVVILKAIRLKNERRFSDGMPALAILALSALAPAGLWLLRNYFVLGDITGSTAKINMLTWTAKPFTTIWDHPIFTPAGALTFWSELMKTFWRGEITWHGERLSWDFADGFYWISSSVFLIAFIYSLLLMRLQTKSKIIDIANFIVFGASILFMAGISISYDYGNCWYPSQEHPYFTSGRLISDALVPFLILYLQGFKILTSRLKSYIRWAALGVIIALMLASEIALSIPVFGSAYNMFHLH
ncbi:MAG: glycosyltransferase family 39 protein [Armatimonadetes bacterium]|nr:glycosyltransferase family 39 protein [Armatimonadota bacterium]